MRTLYCPRLQVWLKEGDRLWQPLSRKGLSMTEFRAQRDSNIDYVVFERIQGTRSDGMGRPAWHKVRNPATL